MSQTQDSRTAVVAKDFQVIRGILIMFSLIGLAFACFAIHEVILLIQTLIAVLS